MRRDTVSSRGRLTNWPTWTAWFGWEWMGSAVTIPIGSGSPLRRAWTRFLAPELSALCRRVSRIGPDVGRSHRRPPCSALPGLLDLELELGDVSLEIVQPQHQRIDSPWLQLAATLPLVDQEAEISRGVVLSPAHPKQLDLELTLVQCGLGFLAERLQLLVQPVEDG